MSVHRPRRGNFALMSSFDYYTPRWGGLFGFLLMFLLGVVISGMAGAAFQVGSMFSVLPDNFVFSYGYLIMYPLMFIPAMIFASARSRSNQSFDGVCNPTDRNGFGTMGGALCAIVAVVLMLSLAFLIDPVTSLLPDMDERTKAAMEMLLNGPFIVSLLCTCVMAPIFEEWLCRGIIMRSLLKLTKPWLAIAISAAFFGLIHGNIWQAIPAFVLGLALGWVYYRTGSLKLTMLMHCANNALSVIASRVPGWEAYDNFADMMGGWSAGYIACLVASAVIGVVCVYLLCRSTKSSASGSDAVFPTSSSSNEEGM